MKRIVLHSIHLFKEQQEINCPENSTILHATLAAHINHAHACGGKAKCSTCRVSIMAGIENCNPRNEAEQKMADRLNFPADIRLAYQEVKNKHFKYNMFEATLKGKTGQYKLYEII